MRLPTIIDLLLRSAAVASAIASSFLVLVVGIMANDSGTPAGARASATILLIGAVLILWVLLCSIRPTLVAELMPNRPALSFLIIKVPSYGFGLAGIGWLLLMGYEHFRFVPLSPEVKTSQAAYPVPNPHPTDALEISGTLPATVPLASVQAVYATDLTAGERAAGPCQLLDTNLPEALRYAVPLEKKDTMPLVRQGGRYHITLYVDRYLPGSCNWHLRQVRYRLFVAGYGYRPINAGIELRDEAYVAAAAAKGYKLYQGRVDEWCGDALNRAVTPYYPKYCGIWNDSMRRVPPGQRSFVPPEATAPEELVDALPAGSHTFEINFHDADAPQK